MSGCAGIGALKIGERQRPNTFTVKPPIPAPCSHEEHWHQKSQFRFIEWKTTEKIVADANNTAQAWLNHPANKMQLPSLQKAHDEDGDGLRRERVPESPHRCWRRAGGQREHPG